MITISRWITMYLCTTAIFTGLIYLFKENQVMTAIFWAILAAAFALLFDGLRGVEK
jgi:hypothetical protein